MTYDGIGSNAEKVLRLLKTAEPSGYSMAVFTKSSIFRSNRLATEAIR